MTLKDVWFLDKRHPFICNEISQFGRLFVSLIFMWSLSGTFRSLLSGSKHWVLLPGVRLKYNLNYYHFYLTNKTHPAARNSSLWLIGVPMRQQTAADRTPIPVHTHILRCAVEWKKLDYNLEECSDWPVYLDRQYYLAVHLARVHLDTNLANCSTPITSEIRKKHEVCYKRMERKNKKKT